MASGLNDITLLLERIQSGDKDAESRLYEIVMPELRRLAQYFMHKERAGHTLQATELVNQMYVRLSGSQLSLRNRGHFFAIAARAMRRELIDYARRRPDINILPLESIPEKLHGVADKRELALVIDELLDQMRETMPTECNIVELKFFFGMTDDETADILGLPVRTMQAKWQDARIWLFERAEAKQWKPSNPDPGAS